MAKSFPNYTPTDTWADLFARGTHSALINQRVTVQSIAKGAVSLYAGGSSAPGYEQGNTLAAGQSWTGTTDHLWLRGNRAQVAIGLED